MREAIQYIRVSSDEQAKGGSLGAQEREGGEYLLKHGLGLLELFVDVETAKSSGRENFGRMLAWLKKQKKPVLLVVEKTDRLYRNYEDMVEIKKLVQAKGHEVQLYREGEILNSATPSHTWLVHYFKVAIAQNYVENLSEEIRKGRKEKLLGGGWPHKAPHGYKNVRNERKESYVIIDEAAAPYIREAFSLYSSGLYSLDRLRDKLHETGYVYKPTMPKMTKGGLAKLLKSCFYVGQMEVNGELYEGKHEALVDRETWLLAQEACRKDGKPLKYGPKDFIYAKLLRCHECGAAMVGEEKRGGRWIYYRCAARRQGCSQGYMNEKALNEAFGSFIGSLELSQEIKDEIMAAAEGLEADNAASEEIRQVEAEIKRYKTNMKRALQEKIEGNIDGELYREISKGYQETIFGLEAKLEKITREDVDFYELAGIMVDIPRTLSQRWPRANTEQKIEILDIVGANYSVEAGKLHYELKEPFSLIGKKALCHAWWSNRDELRNILLLQARKLLSISRSMAA